MHSVAVCALMISLARQLGLESEEVHELGLAGLLHDIGKMEILLDIINKPGKLTDEEFVAMKPLPLPAITCYWKVMASATSLWKSVCIIMKRWMAAAILISLAASRSAYMPGWARFVMCMMRLLQTGHTEGWDPADALRKMAEWTNGHFDPVIFQAFVKSLGIYPIGSLVKLESGRLAVVVEQNQNSLLKPKVKVFFSTKSNLHIVPEIINLSQADMRDKIVAIEDPAQWKFPDLEQLWSDGVITGA